MLDRLTRAPVHSTDLLVFFDRIAATRIG